MSVDSVSVWDEEAALQSCWLDCEASPTSAYRYKHIYKDNGKQVQTYLQRQMQIGAYGYRHKYKVIRELPKGVYKCKYKDKKRKITKCIHTKTIIQRQHKFQKGLEESHSSACSSTTRTHRSRKVREIEL